ncbi:MAG TPA: RluA family pseudouridine synthase [Candidatus Polarisedimenticolia bacterium]|nr:RluA family pseudouridine synthase [Candidatus Polarisedimenticolia bacterium]
MRKSGGRARLGSSYPPRGAYNAPRPAVIPGEAHRGGGLALKTIVLKVAPEEAGRTLQALLHDRAGFSHSKARGLIDSGAVSGPKEVRPGDYARRVAAGERYEVRHDEARGYRERPVARPGRGYRVVHQDRDLLVVEKQPDLLTVPTVLREEEESLVERLLEGERARGVRHPALYALHRLDRDTSGLLLFARSRRAFEGLQAQFAARAVERRYMAVASGKVEPERGRFQSRLVEDPRSLKMRSTRRPDEGKEAITEYEVSERLPGATVLAIRLRTGRKNQIRVHLAEAGHPLIGDRRYGTASPLIRRTALHARSLAFVHPVTGRQVSYDSPPPRDLRRLVKALRQGA